MEKPLDKPHILIDGAYVFASTPAEALAQLLECTPNPGCWSYEALKDLYIGYLDIVVAWSHEMKQSVRRTTKFTKFINQYNKMIKYLPLTQPALVRKIYETILRADNMGLLRGFGVTNQFGDKIKGNPEFQSLTTIGANLGDRAPCLRRVKF